MDSGWCGGTILSARREADHASVSGLSLHVVPVTADPAIGTIRPRLEAALSLSDPVPVFQPIIDLATGTITG